jgi:uncharacterized membrane protein
LSYRLVTAHHRAGAKIDMEAWIVLAALLFFAPLVVSIVVGAQLGKLRSSVEELKRRLTELEGRSGPQTQPAAPKRVVPPPLPAFLQPPPAVPAPARAPSPKMVLPSTINWESILGVKFFAWIGGLALFLGVVFFVKYSFENNLITPTMRVISGALSGTALIIVGVLPALRRYRVPAQSLCATGVLILYADTYAAYSFYNLIPLSAATALMWIFTGLALVLATRLNTQSVAWLGILGGFLTPILFRTKYDNPAVLFGYIGVLNCGVAVVSAFKGWNYLILLAALGSVIMEFTWASDFFGPAVPDTARIIFLGIEVQFLAICISRASTKPAENWSIGAAALAGFATLLFCLIDIGNHGERWALIFSMLLLGNAGLIALAMTARASLEKAKALSAVVAAALALTWLTEWTGHQRMFSTHDPALVIAWYVGIFLLFASAPYFCGVNRLWPWMISAAAGPLQFWFVYQFIAYRFPDAPLWLLPLAFALPAVIGVVYLVQRQHVDLASGDSRLATQGAAVLAFVSLVFPVQFEREWITLGWAIEGLALLLLFRWIPNPRLRAVALIVFCAAFVRLALNPAVLEYHPRTHTPILNWYLYTYGTAGLCFFLGAKWFGAPREKWYERNGSPILYVLTGVVCFLLMNIEIAGYFSIGPTLTFSFEGNFARDMIYTIAWAVFAFGLLLIGIARKVRVVRLAAIALLSCALIKLFLHDLDALSQLYRIGAFFAVAIIAIVASFLYQRFLSPVAPKND